MYGDFPGDYHRLKDRVRRLELQPPVGGSSLPSTFTDLRPHLWNSSGAVWSDQLSMTAGGLVGAMAIGGMVFLRGQVGYTGPSNSPLSLTLFTGIPAALQPAGNEWRDLVVPADIIAGIGTVSGYLVGMRIYAAGSFNAGTVALTVLTKADGQPYVSGGVTYGAGMPAADAVILSLDGLHYDIAAAF